MEGRAIRLRGFIPPREGIERLPVRDQARAVLSFVFERYPLSEYPTPDPECPETCPSCGQPSNGTRSPYCGVACREEAGFVRQVRSGLVDGWLEDEEKQVVVISDRMWRERFGADPALRGCDDAATWDWRDYLAKRVKSGQA